MLNETQDIVSTEQIVVQAMFCHSGSILSLK